MVYKFAAVTEGGAVLGWSGSRDGADKLARSYLSHCITKPRYDLVPVHTLEKAPKDPNPGIKTYNSGRKAEAGGNFSGTMLITEDGTKYARCGGVGIEHGNIWRLADDQDVQRGPITGYLDRLYIIHGWKTWKEGQASV
jgi:hypothetical protein